jgi:hypothetical protein
MAFVNVTHIANETIHFKAFSYLDSTMDKTFPLDYPNREAASSTLSVRSNALLVSASFCNYLDDLDEGCPASRLSAT